MQNLAGGASLRRRGLGVIRLRLETATGRKILAGILKRIKDRDNCSINTASDNDGFKRLAANATAIIADTSADSGIVGAAVVVKSDGAFEHSPLLKMQLYIAPEIKLSDDMPSSLSPFAVLIPYAHRRLE